MGKSKTVTIRGREYWRAAKEFKGDETKLKGPAMTAATPGKELPEVSRDEYERLIDAIDYALAVNGKIDADTPLHESIRKAYRVPGVSRLAAKPADEGIREQAAKLLETRADGFSGSLSRAIFSGNLVAEELRSNAAAIRSLSTTGEPKR